MTGRLWYVDALDARAGQAFAVCRPADLLEDLPDLSSPAVYIAPPSFHPEPVGSRSIGFAAARGSFQLGLFDGEREIGFEALDALVDFVRRLYFGGGAGDAGNGVGPAPPAPPEGGGSDEPEREHADPSDRRKAEDRQAFLTLVSAMSKFGHSRDEGRTPRPPVSHWLVLKTVSVGSPDTSALIGACAALTEALLRRFPGAHSSSLAEWRMACLRLGAVIETLGLSRWLPRHFGSRTIQRLAESIVQSLLDADARPPMPTPDRIGPHRALVCLLHDLSPIELSAWWDDGGSRRWWRPLSRPAHGRLLDPMDSLAVLPLPKPVARRLQLDPQTASARDLLCLLLAKPDLVGSGVGDSLGEDITAILVFAACFIVAVEQPSAGASLSHHISRQVQAFMVTRALAWLADQFPRHRQPSTVERMIETAAALRYR